MPELSEQEQIRRQSLDDIRKMGIDPYPAAKYPVTAHAADTLAHFDEKPEAWLGVSFAGRIMSRRIMGKASFGELMDSSGRIQIYVNRDELCPGDNKDLYNTFFKRLLDIGDIIGVQGEVFKTQKGEVSIRVNSYDFLTKALILGSAIESIRALINWIPFSRVLASPKSLRYSVNVMSALGSHFLRISPGFAYSIKSRPVRPSR